MPRAGAAALVAVKHPEDQRPTIEVLHWDRRLMMGGDFQPSERLILDAIRRGESVLHVWNAADAAGSSAFTRQPGRRLGLLHAGGRQSLPGLGHLRGRPLQRRPRDARRMSPIPTTCATI